MSQQPPVRDARVVDPAAPRPAAADPRAPIDSRTLFAGGTEVQILHRGAVYRLRQTSLGKLILTK